MNGPACRILGTFYSSVGNFLYCGVHGTRHVIVINEVVDLAKRFCDGAALTSSMGVSWSKHEKINDTSLLVEMFSTRLVAQDPLVLDEKNEITFNGISWKLF